MSLDPKLESFRILVEAEAEVANAEQDIRVAQNALRQALLAVTKAEEYAKQCHENVVKAQERAKRIKKAQAKAVKSLGAGAVRELMPDKED